eukprot:15455985-Alexandrium_andersonii.AAC.1
MSTVCVPCPLGQGFGLVALIEWHSGQAPWNHRLYSSSPLSLPGPRNLRIRRRAMKDRRRPRY